MPRRVQPPMRRRCAGQSSSFASLATSSIMGQPSLGSGSVARRRRLPTPRCWRLGGRRWLSRRWRPLPLRGRASGRRTGPRRTSTRRMAAGGARACCCWRRRGRRSGAPGFVSMDNATGTSANLRRFLAAARVDRRWLAIWNAVPWVIHGGGPNRAPRRAEIRPGWLHCRACCRCCRTCAASCWRGASPPWRSLRCGRAAGACGRSGCRIRARPTSAPARTCRAGSWPGSEAAGSLSPPRLAGRLQIAELAVRPGASPAGRPRAPGRG